MVNKLKYFSLLVLVKITNEQLSEYRLQRVGDDRVSG